MVKESSSTVIIVILQKMKSQVKKEMCNFFDDAVIYESHLRI